MMDARQLDAMRLLARALIGGGRFAQARELLTALAAAAPDDLFARRNLAHALLALGDYESAEPVARRLAAEAGGSDAAPALFFHAHALWGCGRLDECRAVVGEYEKALAAERAEEGKAIR